jgi:hypothetical protein
MKESNKKISQFLFYFLFNNIDIILFFILVLQSFICIQSQYLQDIWIDLL